MVTVITCRNPNGIITDLMFDESEDSAKKHLIGLKKNNYFDFKVRDYPNHWGIQFGDFVRELNREPNEEPLPCPKCGSKNIEVDADGMATSLKGIDYQNIWVECLDCEFNHVINVCDYPWERHPTQLCISQWNEMERNIPEDSGNEMS